MDGFSTNADCSWEMHFESNGFSLLASTFNIQNQLFIYTAISGLF